MPLVTVEDIATRLGRPVLPEESARVAAFITDVEALAEEYAVRDFTRRENAEIEVPGTPSQCLAIPRRYRADLGISAVTIDGGQALTDWTRSGPSLWREEGWHGELVTLTASWGYQTPPPALRATICAEVIRWLAVSPGVASERVGDREIEYDSPMVSQALSETAKEGLRRYRPRTSTIPLVREVQHVRLP